MIAFTTNSYSQVSGYGFTQNSGTYTEITGGTILGTASGSTGALSFDSQLWAIADGSIPFNFNFSGTNYTGCSVNSNGFITFGTTTSSSFTSTAISSTTAYNGAISAWSGDLNAAFISGVIAGETRWEVVGTSPNREFVVQFKNWRPSYSTSTTNVPYINFQIRLFETSNVVKVVYGNNGYAAGTTAASSTREIGLRGATNADFNNRANATGTLFTSSTAGTTNGSTQAFNTLVATPGMPISGTQYSWTPPSPCTGTPVAGSASPVSQVVTTGSTPSSLSTTGQSTGVSGLTYQWQESTDGTTGWVNAVGGTGATTLVYTPPVFSGTTIFYRLQVTCTASTLSAVSSTVSLNPCSVITSLPHVEGFDAVSNPSCWSTSVVTGTTNWAPDDTSDGVPSPRTGTRFAGKSWSSNDNALLISPVYDLTAYASSLVRLNVWIYRSANGLVTDRVAFYANTTNNLTGATMLVDVPLPISAAPVVTTAGWYNYTAILPLSFNTGGNFYIIAQGRTTSSFSSYSVGFDDYTLELAPACLAPTNIVASNTTATTVDLTLTSGNSAFEYVVQAQGTGVPAGSGIANTGTTVSVTGLSGSTNYEVYVRSNCTSANNGFSTWAGPIIFSTSCSATNVPYVMNFETATLPALPNCTSQQNVGTGNLWTVVNDGTTYGFTTNALRYRWNTNNNANVWFYTQGVNLVGGTTYKMTFDYGNSGYDESLKVAYGTAANATAMANLIVDYPIVTGSALMTSITDFTPTVSGVYYFGFNAYSNADEFYLFVDNISVDTSLKTSTFVNSSFSAYPNPVRDVLNVSYDKEISNVTVINLLGQVVLTKKVNATQSNVDMSQLNAGVYMVNVEVEGTIKTIKVIKE